MLLLEFFGWPSCMLTLSCEVSYGFSTRKWRKRIVYSSFFKSVFPSSTHFLKSGLLIILKNKVNIFGSLGLPLSIFLSTNKIGILVTLTSIIFSSPSILLNFSALILKTSYLLSVLAELTYLGCRVLENPSFRNRQYLVCQKTLDNNLFKDDFLLHYVLDGDFLKLHLFVCCFSA